MSISHQMSCQSIPKTQQFQYLKYNVQQCAIILLQIKLTVYCSTRTVVSKASFCSCSMLYLKHKLEKKMSLQLLIDSRLFLFETSFNWSTRHLIHIGLYS